MAPKWVKDGRKELLMRGGWAGQDRDVGKGTFRLGAPPKSFKSL